MIRSAHLLAFSLFTFYLVAAGCDRPAAQKDGQKENAPDKAVAALTSNANDSAPSAPSSSSGPSNSSGPTSPADAKARVLLEACIAKYKQLKSYEDNGFLTIRIPSTDTVAPKVFREPMRIAYEAPNRLGIQFRALGAMWSDNASTFEAVVRENDFRPFGDQRLVRPLPASLDLKWLIIDNLGPLIDHEVTGAPIQLQMLFDPKPIAYFLVPTAKISLLDPKEFDANACERVQVILEGLTWVFWIDKEMLLRKYELPSQGIGLLAERRMLPPNFPVGSDFSKCELSMELDSAKANPRIDWQPWRLAREAKELPVRRFIYAPPRNTPRLLDKKMAAFDLFGPDGKTRILDSSQRTKPISVLCWVTNNEIGENLVKVLFEVQAELNRRLISNAEIILISQANGDALQDSLKKWNCTLPLAIDTKNLTQNEFQIQSQPAVVVLDKDARVQYFDDLGYWGAIPDIVESVLRGEKLAKRRIQIALDDEERFNSRLHRAIIDKSQADELPPIGPFQFFDHRISANWAEPFPETIVAASGEHTFPQPANRNNPGGPFSTNAKRQRVMTALDELGHVYVVDNTGTKTWIATIPPGQMENPKRIHVLPDPWLHRWIAILPEGLPRYWLIDTAANTNGDPIDATQFELDDKNESPSAFVWAIKDGEPMLAIATTSSRLEVLSPPDDRRVSDNVGSVAAIVPNLNDLGECEGWYLIKSNGDIQDIEPLRSQKSTVGSSTANTPPKALLFKPNTSPWTWGRHGSQSFLMGISQLPSGETGTVVQSKLFEPRMLHPLSVRPEQCRILSATTLADGALFWLSTAPNRVLHLNTADNSAADQMALGTKIFGAGLYSDGVNLRMVLAVGTEVNCWTIERQRAAAEVLPTAPTNTKKDTNSPPEKSRG